MSSLDGLIMVIGKTYKGSAHDMTILRKMLPQLGEFGRCCRINTGRCDPIA